MKCIYRGMTDRGCKPLLTAEASWTNPRPRLSLLACLVLCGGIVVVCSSLGESSIFSDIEQCKLQYDALEPTGRTGDNSRTLSITTI